MKKILDVCCGGRMFWFDKSHPDTLYVDIRKKQSFITGDRGNRRIRHVLPDQVMDFRDLKLPDESFSLVVFDPPHITNLGSRAYFRKIYGALDKNTWREDLRKGFSECFRVLKPNGVLIFKWNETNVSLADVLELTPVKPLFGHRVAKSMKTHWIAFMK